MKREYLKSWSPLLGRELEVLVFGHAGTPVLAVPTSMGRFFEWEDFGMVAALAPQLESGANRLFCIETLDSETFYARNRPAHPRLALYNRWQRHVVDEFVPLMREWTGNDYIIVAGASFGAFHAANLMLKFPWTFRKLIAMSGSYDIKPFLDGYYDDDVYYNNPVDYLPGLADGGYLDCLSRNDLRLLTGEHDICREETLRFAEIVRSKRIPLDLQVWGHGMVHDWPYWHQMMQQNIA